MTNTEKGVWNYNFRLEHSPTFARHEIEGEIDYISSFYDGRRENDLPTNFTEVKYLREYLKWLGEMLDMYGYNYFIKERV